MASITDITDIKRLRRALEKKLTWGQAESWHSAMFGELSEMVFAHTQVMLSDTTLKRFFGVVNHKGMPSITTLDALSSFAGYENWRDFRKPDTSGLVQSLRSLPAKSIYVSAGFVLAFTVILLFAYQRNSVPMPEGMSFSSRPVTTTYPNSVVFDLNLKNPPTDCLFIQQYWDVTKTIRLKPDQRQATGIYYFPGYFRAQLLVNGTSVDSHDLFLRSHGWLGTLEYDPVPKYFSPNQSSNVALGISDELLNEVAQSEKPLKTVYHYINDLGNVSADNFSLHTTVQNTFNDRWAVCEFVEIYVLGTRGAMIIPFGKTGCSSDLFLMLNDTSFNGKSHDLSMLGTTFDSPTTLGLSVKDRNVEITVQGTRVFTSSYKEDVGQLVGFRFKFAGAGQVQRFSVTDAVGNRVPLPRSGKPTPAHALVNP